MRPPNRGPRWGATDPAIASPYVSMSAVGSTCRLGSPPPRFTAASSCPSATSRHSGAKLPRQWPISPGTVGDDADEHRAAGNRAQDLVQLGLRVDGKEPDAASVCCGDITLLLDRVAIGQPGRISTETKTQLDLPAASHIEI